MFCPNCGSELDEKTNVCPKCGPKQKETTKSQSQSPVIAILSVIFGVLGGWLGLVFSIIGLKTYEKGTGCRTACYVGLCLWLIEFIATIIFVAMGGDIHALLGY